MEYICIVIFRWRLNEYSCRHKNILRFKIKTWMLKKRNVSSFISGIYSVYKSKVVGKTVKQLQILNIAILSNFTINISLLAVFRLLSLL